LAKPPGRITLDPQGRTVFTPVADGRHRYLIVNEIQRARTLEAMIELASQPPVSGYWNRTARVLEPDGK
jgi:hypothetical protein